MQSLGADSAANEEEGLISVAALPTKANLAQLQASDPVEELHSGMYVSPGVMASPHSSTHWADEASR